MSTQTTDQEGAYRIQTVERTTGVPIAVLPAWEKCYGVPHPSRMHTVYRMYTEADVPMVKRLSTLRASGLAASEAARVVFREHAGVASPLQPPTGVAERLLKKTAARVAVDPELQPPTGVAERLLEATRRMDGDAIDETLASLSTVWQCLRCFRASHCSGHGRGSRLSQ